MKVTCINALTLGISLSSMHLLTCSEEPPLFELSPSQQFHLDYSLERSIICKDLESAELYLRWGADPNALTLQGQTPLLHVAAGLSNESISLSLCKMLLLNGAYPNTPDNQNQVPAKIAIEAKNYRSAQQILNWTYDHPVSPCTKQVEKDHELD